MKFFILLLAIVALANAEFSKEEEERWQAFKLEHGKLFLSPGKEKARKTTFLKNAKAVDDHNEAFLKGEATFVKSVHKYSDLDHETFMSRFTGTVEEGDARSQQAITLRGTPPASLDLRSGMGAIRNQNPCGSCWAFCVAASVEYAYWRKTGVKVDVSEQEMVDCVYDASTNSCNGGWITTAMNWINTNGGLGLESEYPYTFPTVSGTCKASSASKTVKLASPSNVAIAGDDLSIKTALNDYGVLSVCVDASGWSGYSGGIYQANYNSLVCNHGVALVGYGTDTNGIPYWLIRNSWDTWFGENGYIRVDARKAANGAVMGGLFLNRAYLPQLA